MLFTRRSALFCVWFAVSLAALNAFAAEPLEPGDRAAVRLVIEKQLAAFADDEAEQAFSLASPKIQEMFITARNFMDMVRIAYPVVYRPVGLSFHVPFVQDSEVWQTVEMRDAQGIDWTALYTLMRQADGLWRINGCVLRRGLGQAV
ncbi:MAG: DUF4864 domain-containing protein [Rhodoferax sp.]|jgi:hypothetical protein|nr:DUF4864 domain-containing protein [Rhodoferax sp.]